jgi:hypothetical protein
MVVMLLERALFDLSITEDNSFELSSYAIESVLDSYREQLSQNRILSQGNFELYQKNNVQLKPDQSNEDALQTTINYC